MSEYPYLAVVDPRTGECMQTYNHITVDILMSALNDMLSTHPSPECVTNDSFTSKKWASGTASTAEKNSASDSTTNVKFPTFNLCINCKVPIFCLF